MSHRASEQPTLSTSERYQVLPPLSEDEYRALKADIAVHGVLVPVEVDDTGEIIDGHHRARAWRELRAEGVKVPDYPRVVRLFASEEDKLAHALVLNLARRHLTRGQRRELVVRLREGGWSLRRIAGAVGVNEITVRRDLGPATNVAPARVNGTDGKQYPAIYASNGRDAKRAGHALRVLGPDAPPRMLSHRRAEALGRYANLARLRKEHGDNGTVCSGDGFELRLGDFREVLADLPDASVDALIVDPPFDDKSLELWSDLSVLGARVLKEGRVLVAYAGILRLDDHIARLGENLRYVWCGSTAFSKPSFIHCRQVWSHWRPWLVFSNGRYQPRGLITDRVVSIRDEHGVEDHPWRQAVGPFRSIVTSVTEPGELVLDPCCGQGTTGEAALLEGRRFLEVDSDAGALALATGRLQGLGRPVIGGISGVGVSHE